MFRIQNQFTSDVRILPNVNWFCPITINQLGNPTYHGSMPWAPTHVSCHPFSPWHQARAHSRAAHNLHVHGGHVRQPTRLSVRNVGARDVKASGQHQARRLWRPLGAQAWTVFGAAIGAASVRWPLRRPAPSPGRQRFRCPSGLGGPCTAA